MPTDSTSVAMLDICFESLTEDLLSFREKGKILVCDFNARVGKTADDDDVISKFGEDTCNACGNKLISPLHEVELVACKERVRTSVSFDQNSVILMHKQLMAVLGSIDIGSLFSMAGNV